jgi:hypothetical protein
MVVMLWKLFRLERLTPDQIGALDENTCILGYPRTGTAIHMVGGSGSSPLAPTNVVSSETPEVPRLGRFAFGFVCQDGSSAMCRPECEIYAGVFAAPPNEVGRFGFDGQGAC